MYTTQEMVQLYLTRSKSINKFIFGGNILPYLMNEIDSIDIDSREDVLKAELFLNIERIKLIEYK